MRGDVQSQRPANEASHRRRAPSGLRARAGARLAAALLSALVAALAGAQAAGAAAPLEWSTPAGTGAGSITSISCPSESLCVAVDGSGYVLTSSNAFTPAPTWTAALIDRATAIDAVSCASAQLCVAVDHEGSAIVSSDPAGGASAWSRQPSIDARNELTGISCPGVSLCVAVDASGGRLASTDPGSAEPRWSTSRAAGALRGVSCASESLCVAVSSAGEALESSDPGAPSPTWRATRIDPSEGLLAVSCGQPGYCVAVDGEGNVLAGADPGAAAPTWSETPIAPAARLGTVSCSGAGLCVALSQQGVAYASDDPDASVPEWSESSAESGASPVSVSCLAGGLCAAVDSAGRSFSGRVPAPLATTLGASAGESGALLAGSVDPHDADLSSCAFEYGLGTGYGQSVPCSSPPSPTGGAQTVSAQLGGLQPNATYHYRLIAASAAGTGAGADASLTTAVSAHVALVHPAPSISGTPAVGQRLSCRSGVQAGAGAGIAYVWLRDLVPIPNASGSVYTVKGQDTGHHLQCQVSATDGGGTATAVSAFVTVPVEGVLAATGETEVGAARQASAGLVQVPVTCSAQASYGCRIAARLVLEQRGRATIGSTRARLAAGQSRVLAIALTRATRRLIARHGSVAAELALSGTVIGIIEATLSRQRLELGRSAGRAAAHVLALSAAAPGPPPSRRAQAHEAALLASTPYMGWDTYFALGGRYSEATVLREASELLTLGLARRGYRYVWLDVGWWQGARRADGHIEVSSAQWPHGLAWLTHTLHDAGLKVGLYTDAGANGCGGARQGSYGHYQQDANTFAQLGFDAVKVDFCGGEELHLNPRSAYTVFHQAIVSNSAHRLMLLSICNFLQPGEYAEGEPPLGESVFSSYSFGPSVGNSWRTDTDVGFPGAVYFESVLRNMDADAADPQAAGPGHWNDPDYLAPDQGMSAVQFRTQLSMWAMLAAPLMISDDLTRISPASLQAVQNTEVIGIDQDPAGLQGTLLSAAGNGQVWVKPLHDGSRAIALLNRGSAAVRLSAGAREAGLPSAASYTVHNVWTHTTYRTSSQIAALVPGDATVLLRVYPN